MFALLLGGVRCALAADPPFPGPTAPLELAEADRRARAGEMVEARRIYERLAAGSDPAVAAEATKRRPRVERALDAWGRLAKAFGRLRVAQTELPPADGDDLLAQLLGPSSHPGSVVDALRYDEGHDALAAIDVSESLKPADLRTALRLARATLLYRALAPPGAFPVRAELVLQAERLVQQAIASADAAWRDAIAARLSSAEFEGLPPALWEEMLRRAPHPARGDPGTYEEEYDVPYNGSGARYHLFVPACYRPSRPRPLLVALHYTAGEGKSMLNWWRSLGGDQTYIIVAPTATAYRTQGWAKTELERSCIVSAIEHVRARWAVDPDRIYLTGYSMGGHASWDLGIEFADRWAGVLPMAGAPFDIGEGRLQNLLKLPVFTYFGAKDTEGSRGGITGLNEEATRTLQKQGTDLTVVEDHARGHMLELTREHALAFYAWMDARRRVVYPKLFRSVYPAFPARRAYWIDPIPEPGKPAGLDPLKPPPPGVFVRVEIKPGNKVQVYADRMGDFDCYVGGPDLDLVLPVRLSLNGSLVFEGPRPRDLRFLLSTVARTHDAGWLFWNRVKVRAGKGE
ncbi:MAG: hypothetical protein HYZ53_15830 [Planctomycetes bacterium]|nr:hypothetical protein [Planctomycetota bacterium]